MSFGLLFTDEAKENLDRLQANPHFAKECKAVMKALAYLEVNPKHPSLNTHKFESLSARYGHPVFEAYAQNNTPGAYRIFWHYGPKKNEITILAIIAHPK